MSIPVEVLEAEVLSLPQADRARLIDRLLMSLEKDPEWEASWAAEADRRERRIAEGETAWVPGPEALARIRQNLA
jgi:Putative addiction module component